MEIELTVITTQSHQELVLLGEVNLGPKECLALVDLAEFTAAMDALRRGHAPDAPPETLWMERRKGSLIPLDQDSQRQLSEIMAGRLIDWVTT